MNYKLLSVTAISVSTLTVNNAVVAQRTCGIMQHEAYLQQQNPNRALERQAYEQVLQHWIDQNANQKAPAVITIPVVVHVVYKNATENISDAQIQSQIDVLNEDFRRLNADASNTPSVFSGVAADCEIEFCLAQRDPNGNPTNGIVRVQTSEPEFNASFPGALNNNDEIKRTADGGSDPWDVSRYFNFWVCYLGNNTLGYGEFPTGSLSNTYGQVCTYTAFGTMGAAQAPFNGGRTTTHELGHCFNLFHIWGDDQLPAWGDGICQGGSECSGSDQVGDTPNACEMNYGCPSFPNITSCGNTPNGEMYMNYMDYTDDACMNLFTQGQKTRMLAVLNTAPWNVLQNSNGCVPLTAAPLDAGISAITSPTGSICATSFSPVVTLKNFGSSALTSVTIKYSVDGGTALSYAWTGNLAANATTSVTLPTVNSTTGSHSFAAYTENPNGSSDGNAANDQSTSNFTITTGGGTNLPLVEGFESSTFPPNNWTINNPDNLRTWERTTNAAKTGIASAYIENSNYTANGEIDELTSPTFTVGSNAILSFDLAYCLWTDPNASQNWSDTLTVYYSSTCGTSWTQIYKKFGSALATKTPVFQGSSFTPLSSQWRTESVYLTPYFSGSNTGMIKFHHTNDFENNMYIDNVNISSTTSAAQRSYMSDLAVYPNPSNGLVFVSGSKMDEVRVFDLLGNLVQGNQASNNETMEINIHNQASGVYFIKVTLQDQSIETFKILKN